jgi:ParB family chromosome partitioning protein
VPVILREASTQQLTEWALVENVQRDDLNAIEEAAAYHALMHDYGLTQAEVAACVGKSRPAVANTVRLLLLPLPVQQAVIDGALSAGHARALLTLPDAELQLAAMQQMLSHELNVRQAEALVKRLLESPPAARTVTPAPQENPQHEAHWREMENRFRASLGTKVSLDRNKEGGGRLVIHFYNDDDLAAIYRQIAGDEEL